MNGSSSESAEYLARGGQGTIIGSAAAKAGTALISPATQLALYRSMVEMRTFEKRAYDLFLQLLVKGTTHLGTGQEAIAAGFWSRDAER